jgi:cbb3-type cytochrome oxidase maturation protein
MTALVWLIPCALLLGLTGLAAFLWSLKTGQYEDLEGASWRALQDDEPGRPKSDSREGPARARDRDRHAK